MKKEKILIGLSGGVDSAVAAALLLQQGYEVVGGFMKNYISDTGNCTTYKDAEEAIKVANHLGIELLSFDLQKEYQERIIDYIFDGYKKGITPNPDVLCNSLIKFDVFLERAMEMGFDKIATGHYARISDRHTEGSEAKGSIQREKRNLDSSLRSEGQDTPYQLLRGVDHNKDQSYFLAGLNQYQLSKSLFPLGGLEKGEVRELAKQFTLPNAERKDSQGLCFIGNVPIREFLLQRFKKKEGDIITLEGKKVGTHQGAYFYTIGQKHGLGLNFKAYVYRIDIKNNILYVTDKDNKELQSKSLIAKDWHWIDESIRIQKQDTTKHLNTLYCTGKIRYRQNPPVACTLELREERIMEVIFDDPQRAVAPGQVFVAYDGEVCLGSGIIG
ncbi:MAG: tRNA 2-thiouridine(34) synthase MnmA [Candidatus Absconditabacteria bacterium]|nr:tRNA 2-thiouridine(34) synthase MnmA [Candidatus Absconditabacteria bacterium]MDD3868014.1 tRNA 2-thiouridine(34) synthase MnmA [Candidatus Absconditabacteria bacterium]MDD4714261.1 tRNA 2-thiouridine(34) synthase MnmA [Candidatus Absconditabacteria bacterium]